MRGVSVTDLPLRQCLYFGTVTDNFLLASYNDMVTTHYWKTLQENFDDEFVPTTKQFTVKKSKIEKIEMLKSTCTCDKDYNKVFKLKK